MQKDTHAGGVILIATAGAVFILDQLVKKGLLAAHPPAGEPTFATPWRWLSISASANEGIAFSLPFPRTLLIVLSTLIVAAAIGWWVKYKEKTAGQAIALGLFVGGAIGNLSDRIVRGAVVDYLNVLNGSFNLADAAIITGILLLIFRRGSKSGTISS